MASAFVMFSVRPSSGNFVMAIVQSSDAMKNTSGNKITLKWTLWLNNMLNSRSRNCAVGLSLRKQGAVENFAEPPTPHPTSVQCKFASYISCSQDDDHHLHFTRKTWQQLWTSSFIKNMTLTIYAKWYQMFVKTTNTQSKIHLIILIIFYTWVGMSNTPTVV